MCNKDSKGIRKLLEGWTEQTAITLVYVYVCLVCVCMCLCMCMCVFVFAMEIAKACDGNRSLRIEIATRDEIRDVIAMDKSLAAIQIACGDGAAKFNAASKLRD